eukprot:140462-Amphidinium_carterae.1
MLQSVLKVHTLLADIAKDCGFNFACRWKHVVVKLSMCLITGARGLPVDSALGLQTSSNSGH